MDNTITLSAFVYRFSNGKHYVDINTGMHHVVSSLFGEETTFLSDYAAKLYEEHKERCYEYENLLD